MNIGYEAMLVGPHYTGVGRAILGLLHALAAPNQDRLVVYTHDGNREAMPSAGNVTYQYNRMARCTRMGRIFWQQWPWARRKHAVDVYHCPGYVLPAGLRVPSVVTIYDTIALDAPHLTTRANAAYYRFALPTTVRRADLIIVPSRYVRDRVCERFRIHDDRVRVIPLGIDNEFRPYDGAEALRQARQRYCETDDFVVLVVGTIERKKNLHLLVRLAHRLATETDLRICWLLVGKPGNASGDLRSLVRKLGMENRVHFLGYVARDFLSQLYTLADVFVYPSLSEGFGFPPLEAMRCGTPVISAKAGSLSEVLGDAAVLVDTSDEQAWLNAIVELLTDESQRSEIRRRGTARAQSFNWEDTAAAVRAVYSEVAS